MFSAIDLAAGWPLLPLSFFGGMAALLFSDEARLFLSRWRSPAAPFDAELAEDIAKHAGDALVRCLAIPEHERHWALHAAERFTERAIQRYADSIRLRYSPRPHSMSWFRGKKP